MKEIITRSLGLSDQSASSVVNNISFMVHFSVCENTDQLKNITYHYHYLASYAVEFLDSAYLV